jgi:hypothetical protein
VSLLKEIDEQSKCQINEGKVSIETLMILDEVLCAGKITNGAQTFVLSRLLMALKSGTITRIANFNEVTTPLEIVNTIKTLPHDQLLMLVAKLKAIMCMENSSYTQYFAPEMSLTNWLSYVHQKNDGE